jgi:hypothetical protein
MGKKTDFVVSATLCVYGCIVFSITGLCEHSPMRQEVTTFIPEAPRSLACTFKVGGIQTPDRNEEIKVQIYRNVFNANASGTTISGTVSTMGTARA